MNKNIVVTGGAGFIGSHLCQELLARSGYNIWSLDNYSTGNTTNHLDGVTYINGDTWDIDRFIDFSPDIVYHLGEYSRVEQSFEEIDRVWQSNIVGTRAVLEFCRKHCCKIVYAGSSTKFGDGGLGRSQSPYGWTKAANTELVQNYGSWFDVPHAITYFYNAYGEREIRSGKYATLIALFAEKMRHGESLTVVSPGEQKRNFTYVKDIVRGLILVGENGEGDEFGIGNPQSYSILEIARMFGGAIEMLPARRGNRMMGEVVADKTRQLGWEPTMSVVDYIEILRARRWEP